MASCWLRIICLVRFHRAFKDNFTDTVIQNVCLSVKAIFEPRHEFTRTQTVI